MTAVLPARWHPHSRHEEQRRLKLCLRSRHPSCRNTVAFCGRRSGKTEHHLRDAVEKACNAAYHEVPGYTQVFGAPVYRQVKEVAWAPLKALAPRAMVKRFRESDLTIEWATGARTIVAGMDKPERCEGFPIDELYMDEYADMRPTAWEDHLRPSLSTPGRLPGRAHFYGTPDGRNHFFDLVERAAELPNWQVFHWISADIIDAAELAEARSEMDAVTYKQEFEASFETFTGLCYYPFSRAAHLSDAAVYDPNRPLEFCFDFNVDPGSCVVVQDLVIDDCRMECIVGEVAIPRNSTTASVCRKLVADWGHHEGEVLIYGDPAGGARSTQNVEAGQGDWSIVQAELGKARSWQLRWRVARAHPRQKDRVNVTNARLRDANDDVHTLIHPSCKSTVRDFEAVVWKEGADFEIEKGDDKTTHWTDAFGYRQHMVHGGTGHVCIQREAF